MEQPSRSELVLLETPGGSSDAFFEELDAYCNSTEFIHEGAELLTLRNQSEQIQKGAGYEMSVLHQLGTGLEKLRPTSPLTLDAMQEFESSGEHSCLLHGVDFQKSCERLRMYLLQINEKDPSVEEASRTFIRLLLVNEKNLILTYVNALHTPLKLDMLKQAIGLLGVSAVTSKGCVLLLQRLLSSDGYFSEYPSKSRLFLRT